MEVEELPGILLQLAETGEKFAYDVYHSAVEGRRALWLLLLSHYSGHIQHSVAGPPLHSSPVK